MASFLSMKFLCALGYNKKRGLESKAQAMSDFVEANWQEEADFMRYLDEDITRQHEDEIMGEDTQVIELQDIKDGENISRFLQDPWQNKKKNLSTSSANRTLT